MTYWEMLAYIGTLRREAFAASIAAQPPVLVAPPPTEVPHVVVPRLLTPRAPTTSER